MDIRKELEIATDNLAVGFYDRDEFYDKILSLMGDKETGGLSTSTEDGVSHIVSECNASGASTTKEVRSNGLLEKRTDYVELCPSCDSNNLMYCKGGFYFCNDCKTPWDSVKVEES